MERVVLVDEHGEPIGTQEKLRAHQHGGQLHRAFSAFIFNSHGELLLQQRALGKYHFGGLWANTCCSHPRVSEQPVDAVHRRLVEEMGFATPVAEAFTFVYQATDAESGLTEHEFDHVFVGTYDGAVRPNPAEVADWKWAAPREIARDLHGNPSGYTPWFHIAFARLMERRGEDPTGAVGSG